MFPLYRESEIDQRTNGPVNAHLISGPSKRTNIQNLKKQGQKMTLSFNTHLLSLPKSIICSCLHLQIIRPLAAIVSEISTVFPFSYRKSEITKFDLDVK